MPTITDYPIVLERLTKQGFKSLYHNSGAFGFGPEVSTISRGWIGQDDPVIRESVRSIVRQVPPPYEQTMADLAVRLWRESLAGIVWMMPKSHWAYELEFGNRAWLPGLLGQMGIDSSALLPLNNAAAIEFTEDESAELRPFIAELLRQLTGSDFQMVFPGRQTVCTIHHRRQLWWTTADSAVGVWLDEALR